MAMKKETGGKYSLKHESQTHGKGIGIPSKVVDSMPKGGGSGGMHSGQPSGHGIGVPTRSNPVKNMGIGSPGNGAGIFKSSGKVLINSGVKGAHRLGCKK
jgi:hypothetical protein